MSVISKTTSWPTHRGGSSEGLFAQSYGSLLIVDRDLRLRGFAGSAKLTVGPLIRADLGAPIDCLLSIEACARIRANLEGVADNGEAQVIVGVKDVLHSGLADLWLVRQGDHLVIEIEAHVAEDISSLVTNVVLDIARITPAWQIARVGQLAVETAARLTGCDHVLFCRFRSDGSAQIIADRPFDGRASLVDRVIPAEHLRDDIGEQALHNRLEYIPDVAASDVSVVIEPELVRNGFHLRSATMRGGGDRYRTHLQFAGARSSTVVLVFKRNEPWGMLVCQSRTFARGVSLARRKALLLFADLLSMQLANADDSAEQRFQERLDTFEAATRDARGEPRPLTNVLHRCGNFLRREFNVSGAALVQRGTIFQTGEFLPEDAVMDMIAATAGCAERTRFAVTLPLTRSPLERGGNHREAICLPLCCDDGSLLIAWRPSSVMAALPSARHATGAARPALSPVAFAHPPQAPVVRQSSSIWNQRDDARIEAVQVVMGEVLSRLAASTRAGDEFRDVVVNELNHRMKNLFSLVTGVVQNADVEGRDVDALRSEILSRVNALSRAHTSSMEHKTGKVSLKEIVNTAIAPFAGCAHKRVQVTGDDAYLKPDAASSVALVIHELTTNCAKYGGLADRDGSLLVSSARRADGAVVLGWQESADVGDILRSDRRGFGSTLIRDLIPYEIGGEVKYDLRADGLRVEIVIPAAALQGEAAPHAATNVTPAPGAAEARKESPVSAFPTAKSVLIVEDNFVVASTLKTMLRHLGFKRVEMRGSSDAALETIDAAPITFALVDCHLMAETGEQVASALRQRRIPYAVVSGAQPSEIASLFPRAPRLAKPFTQADLEAVCTLLMAARARPTGRGLRRAPKSSTAPLPPCPRQTVRTPANAQLYGVGLAQNA